VFVILFTFSLMYECTKLIINITDLLLRVLDVRCAAVLVVSLTSIQSDDWNGSYTLMPWVADN